VTPYERVQLSRQRTQGVFPLPSVLDCIRYAITELAEYDDALLRQERQGDKRNNIKQMHDPRSELGQCAYMIVSAMIQMPEYSFDTPSLLERDGILRTTYHFCLLSNLASAGENATYSHCKPEVHEDLQWAWEDLVRLCDWHGWDVDHLVDETCNRFEQKHAPAREIA
jgi:hypothetical protein